VFPYRIHFLVCRSRPTAQASVPPAYAAAAASPAAAKAASAIASVRAVLRPARLATASTNIDAACRAPAAADITGAVPAWPLGKRPRSRLPRRVRRTRGRAVRSTAPGCPARERPNTPMTGVSADTAAGAGPAATGQAACGQAFWPRSAGQKHPHDRIVPAACAARVRADRRRGARRLDRPRRGHLVAVRATVGQLSRLRRTPWRPRHLCRHASGSLACPGGGYYEGGSLIWRSRWAGSSRTECREALALPADPHRIVILRRIEAVDGPARVNVLQTSGPGSGAAG
jgi:hypothetical protein